MSLPHKLGTHLINANAIYTPKLKIQSFCIREKTILACTRGDTVADSTTKQCTYTLQDSAAVRKLQRAPRILLGSSIGVEDEKVCPT